MKNTKKLYANTLIGIFTLMPLIILITYFTYTEKYVVPIMLLIIAICLFKLRKEL